MNIALLYSLAIPAALDIVVLISCNEPHSHPEIDFRDGNENRGVSLADHLVNAEKSFIMPYESIRKNGCQTLADSCQSVPRDISGYHILDILVTRKDIPAVRSVLGFEQGITYEVDAFVMTFEEHGAFLYYLKPSLDYHRALLVNGSPAPSFVALGKPFPDKSDSVPAA